MSWNNFNQDDNNQDDQTGGNGSDTENIEPKKLIKSVELIDTLSDRTNELTSKILSDIDKDTGLAKQIINLNITAVNKASTKDANYKTEEDKLEAYKNFILNHENEDLLKNVTSYSVSVERKKRYDIYDQILDSNYIAFRILKAYLNNTLIKNAQTKTFLSVRTPDEKADLLNYSGREIKNSYDKFNKSILLKYKLQRKLKEIIVPKTLLYGNYFIEIIDLNRLKNIAQNEQVIMESDSTSTKSTSGNQKKKSKLENDVDNLFIYESNFDCYDNENDLLEEISKMADTKSVEEAAYGQNLVKYDKDKDKWLLENDFVDMEDYTNQRIKALDDYKNIIGSKILTESDTNLEFDFKFKEMNLKVPTNPCGIDSLLEETLLESGVDTFDLDFLKDLGIKTKTDKKQYNLEDISKLKFDSLKDIFLNYIHPRNVIIIERDSLIYGYLIVEEEGTATSGGEYVVDRFKRFSTGLSSSSSEGTKKEEDVISITEKLTDEIIKKVISNIKLSKNRLYSNSYDYFKTLDLGEEATVSLKLLIYNKIKQKSKLKFRFLTPDSLINFNTGMDKFAPYGTSVFDPIVGPVKLYTLALMSSVVSRLSRAAVIRKWTIEAGEKRNHKEIVQKTQSELKSKAITYDKINTLKNISEIVTDFRDMATITINGQRYIDMEIMPMQDRGLPLNDLNDLKQDIISGGGVPPVYLNMGDTTDLREALVHLNVTFANDIIDKQQSLEDGINSLNNNLFKKVLFYNGYEDSDFELSNYSEIKLNAPLVLQIQSDEAMITTVSNIVGLLEQAKFTTNPKTLFKKYIPSINWDILEKEGQDYIKSLGKKAIASGDGMQGGF